MYSEGGKQRKEKTKFSRTKPHKAENGDGGGLCFRGGGQDGQIPTNVGQREKKSKYAVKLN